MVKTLEDYGLSWGRRIEALCQCTGYFNYQYGLVELAITALLAKALDYEDDYEKFDLLIKGLDASGKIERLLSAEPYMPIGENLRLLLGDFKDKDVNSWRLQRQGREAQKHHGSLVAGD
jgi:hypothetical protein